MPVLNSTQRFSDRVADYVKYRPGYPSKMVDYLRDSLGVSNSSLVADIGSGTGILTEVLLQNVKKVWAVEPNIAMRMSAEEELGRYKNFVSVNAAAEMTGLETEILDFVFVAQAFHWFDQEKARREFRRILKPNGQLVLIWNDRQTDTTPFLKDYESLLLQHSTDYSKVNALNRSEAEIAAIFESESYRKHQFKNHQAFKFDGLLGRLCSSSYTPKVGQPNYETMRNKLLELFEKHQKSGKVRIEYATNVYSGVVKA